MSTTSMLLGGAAAPHVLEYEGRRYEFRALTQAVKSEFERWLMARTTDVILRLYEGLEREAELATLRREAIHGGYDFHGPLASQVRATNGGIVKLASLLMGCGEDEVAKLLLNRPDEVKHTLKLVIGEALGPAGLRAMEEAEQRSEQAQKPQDTDRGNAQAPPAA